MPLNVIQRQLGHAHLGVTSIYLQGIDTAEIVETVRSRNSPVIPAASASSQIGAFSSKSAIKPQVECAGNPRHRAGVMLGHVQATASGISMMLHTPHAADVKRVRLHRLVALFASTVAAALVLSGGRALGKPRELWARRSLPIRRSTAISSTAPTTGS